MKRRLTHLVFLIFYVMLRILPRGIQSRMADGLGSLAFRMSAKHRELMVSNMKRAFGDTKSEKEMLAIAEKSYQYLCRSAFEFIRFPVYDSEDIARIVRIEGMENLQAALARGKGVIVTTAHYGAWELMAARLCLETSLTAVGRDQNDGFINSYIIKLRTSKGTKNIPRGTPMFEHITGLLKNNELVGLVSDQNAGTKSIFVEFFDSLVATFKGPGLFAVKTGCAIVPMFIIREGYEKHRIEICPAVEIEPTGDAGLDVKAYTQAFTKVIEKYVADYPEHWFWVHKRWKTSPPGMDCPPGK